MEISKIFVLKTSPAVAWAFLTDPRRVASCLPGARVTEQRDERTHAGTITVKVGPVSATYRGTLRFDRLDPATYTAEMSAAGQDVRGKGGADMRMTSRLAERGPGETEVSVVSEVNVMGMLAQFGRGMIQDVSDQMFTRFVEAMRAQLEAAPPVASPDEAPAFARAGTETRESPGLPSTGRPPMDLLSIGPSVAARAVARAASRPATWVGLGALIALLVGYRLSRHRKESLRTAA